MILTTLDEVIDYLVSHTSAGEKAEFLSHKDCQYHFSTGMGLRNRWKLWEPSSPLSQFFATNGVFHADDTSACIFKAFRAHLQNKPFDLVAEAAHYKTYWESLEKGIQTFKVTEDRESNTSEDTMNFNETMLAGLIADADQADCSITLEITSQGAILTLKKDTTVTGTTDLARQTILTRWLDRNNPDLNHDITKAFRSLP